MATYLHGPGCNLVPENEQAQWRQQEATACVEEVRTGEITAPIVEILYLAGASAWQGSLGGSSLASATVGVGSISSAPIQTAQRGMGTTCIPH
ncbi:hypothetical protein [Thermogemmatispora tikiterensis]|uniref:Uncharacterized protein n=1 Tax=Thermogemmatispora tikiterensis TaxID=1825093 RepID=A0A328VDN0_9CHLR|nr:hypothetical protein [Thermogemmatispora tikiterensis]RAQ94092.1 hypothetical protein A4R35_01015 [Thermogemmatispora tikiterensis]